MSGDLRRALSGQHHAVVDVSEEQLRLVNLGYTMRVYVPYGTQWYGYLMRRMAERPGNVAFFLRALRSRK